MTSSSPQTALKTRPKIKRCLSCGTSQNMSRRKYCSQECRQRLLSSLNRRTGLLKALQTRYATFYFTDQIVMIDILRYGSIEIFSYILPRRPNKQPVEDFRNMFDLLGNAWWAEKRRTHKRYTASQFVLDKALLKDLPVEEIIPPVSASPSVKKSCLVHLRLEKSVLGSGHLKDEIKNAYRKQVKIHHPDLGGNSETFLKIHDAYKTLINWAEHPTFVIRRGFPDKWLYEGYTNRWAPPNTMNNLQRV